MRSDPFFVDGPTCISFSGGRTSAYMLWRVLQSNGGLPDDALVCFANTGREEEATLRFVRVCSERWGVPITWLEFRDDAAGYAVVDFDSASRDGEPFEALIRKRSYLPNPITRFCTSELKIRPMSRHLRALGWVERHPEGWDQMIGIRSDEQRRVAKIRARGHSAETALETMLMPLADAKVTVNEVNQFWSMQGFNLDLTTHNGRTLAGNCDLCFLKPMGQIVSLIAERPARAVWWARMEALGVASQPDGARFRNDRPGYAAMAQYAEVQNDMFGHAEDAPACFCGD